MEEDEKLSEGDNRGVGGMLLKVARKPLDKNKPRHDVNMEELVWHDQYLNGEHEGRCLKI